jgi:hypothetical protein
MLLPVPGLPTRIISFFWLRKPRLTRERMVFFCSWREWWWAEVELVDGWPLGQPALEEAAVDPVFPP